MTIEQRVYEVNNNIERVCALSGRKKEDVKLIAVTKTRTCEEINRVIEAGITAIGENRVQEFLEKYEFIDQNAEKHLIGQLQTNKVKYIFDKISLIHSLDRISLAQELNKYAQKKENSVIKALVEVNIGAEPTKSGVLSDNLTEYLDILTNFRYIKPIGLMTVAPSNATEKEQNIYFEKMFELLQRGKKIFGEDFCQLSMGMSRDYEAAIRQGATMIRLGTALFGERNYNI